jgi:hypothetical protein
MSEMKTFDGNSGNIVGTTKLGVPPEKNGTRATVARRSSAQSNNGIWTPRTKVNWEGLKKDGRTSSVVCFGMENTVPKICEQK